MAIEYLGLSSINGPLVVLEGVENAFYDDSLIFPTQIIWIFIKHWKTIAMRKGCCLNICMKVKKRIKQQFLIWMMQVRRFYATAQKQEY